MLDESSRLMFKYILFFVAISNGYENPPLIMWWTPLEIPGNMPIELNCQKSFCMLTSNRNYTNESKAFIFYGSDVNTNDFPLPRNRQIWALISEESPKNNDLLMFNETLNLFNISTTFSRYSNLPTPLQYLPSLNVITDSKHFQSVEEKNLLLNSNKTAPILYLQSSCQTPIERDSLVQDLMKFIQIDSYGLCLNNKRLPKSLLEDYINNFYTDEILQFISQYKFMITIENAECEDYVTEKLWRSLAAGAIPIYKGSPTIREWLPNQKSAILMDDFPTIKDLARYLKKLNTDSSLYNEYLTHKTEQLISNSFLIETANKQNPNFNCYVCDVLHEAEKNLVHNLMVSTKHYNCSYPKSRKFNSWRWFWDQGKCKSLVIKHLHSKNRNYSSQEFLDTYDKYVDSKCIFDD